MIAAFFLLMALGFVLVLVWIAWWLVSDLFSRRHARPASIIAATDARRQSASPSSKRTGHRRLASGPIYAADSIAAAASHMASFDEPRTTAVPIAEWTISASWPDTLRSSTPDPGGPWPSSQLTVTLAPEGAE